MSIKGVVQVILHLENYYILEYPYQGLFSFHCSLYQSKNNERVNTAIPYQILSNSHPLPQEQFHRIILQPSLDDQKAISSIALAKYSDELIPLDNWFNLRMELEAFPQLETEGLFLEIELRLNNTDISTPDLLGTLIETVIFRVNDLQNGIFSKVEAHFSAPFVSKLTLTMFSVLSGFKFGKYEITSKQPTKIQKQRSKITSIYNLINYASHQYKFGEIQKVFYANYIKKLRICQYLIRQRLLSLKKHPKQEIIHVSENFLKKINAQKATAKDFKEYLDNFIPDPLTIDDILNELNEIRQQNFHLIQTTIKEWMSQQIEEETLSRELQTFAKQKYGEMVFKSTVVGVVDQGKQNSYHQNKKVAHEMRNRNIILNSYPLEDIRFERNKADQEMVFYEITHPLQKREELKQIKMTQEDRKIQEAGNKYQYNEKHMLVVLCHGYQGTSYDMYLIRRWIQQQLPDAHYLVSKSNQDDTDGDIKKMGQNLAQEIQNYIKNYMDQYEQENVIINLVGHSMGGVIARSALPHLQKYNQQFGFFCSLSSPHLGYLNGVSKLIKVGFWAIRTFKKISSLQQLSMEERGDPRKTFLYELSKTGHLRYFRKIILLSSFEDSYVSWHSARISTHRSKNSRSVVQEEMVHNILGDNIYGANIHRLDINFNVKEKTLDSFIGRTAHINLIIRENLFKTISITIPKLFELTEFGREGLFI